MFVYFHFSSFITMSPPFTQKPLFQDPPQTLQLPSPHLRRRMRQFQFAYVTEGYKRFKQLLREAHEKACPHDPQHPPLQSSHSKRQWDGIYRKWRRELHVFDLCYNLTLEQARFTIILMRTTMIYTKTPVNYQNICLNKKNKWQSWDKMSDEEKELVDRLAKLDLLDVTD